MDEEMTTVTAIKPDSYSVKTTTDVTERIQELVKKTGLNHKDLFSAMVTRYYAELEAGSELDQSDDMQQIRYHLSRVENIFLGSLQKVQDLRKDYAERLDVFKAKNKEVHEELQQLNNMHSAEINELKATKTKAEKEQQKILQRNQELELSNQDNRMSVDLLNQKVKELESTLEGTVHFEKELNAAKEELTLVKQERDNLQIEISTEQQFTSKLEDQLTEAEALAQKLSQEYREKLALERGQLQESAQKELDQLRQLAKKEIQQLKELHALEKDKLLIEADRRVLEKQHAVQESYEQKAEKLLNRNEILTAKNQDLAEKLHALELELLNYKQ